MKKIYRLCNMIFIKQSKIKRNKIKSNNDLVFYYRVKLDNVFTNLKYSFNKLVTEVIITNNSIPI